MYVGRALGDWQGRFIDEQGKAWSARAEADVLKVGTLHSIYMNGRLLGLWGAPPEFAPRPQPCPCRLHVPGCMH
jgi:hypothetical protein